MDLSKLKIEWTQKGCKEEFTEFLALKIEELTQKVLLLKLNDSFIEIRSITD